MPFYRNVLFPLLTRLDPETAHEWACRGLEWAQEWEAGRWLLKRLAGEIAARPVEVCGLRFPNVLGVAAGFDKDVRVAEGLACLGYGHVEVGTLTPRPQRGNPRPRIFRLPREHALINRMGFPNGGVRAAMPRLRRLSHVHRTFRLGVSIGKQKETPLADAAGDYLACMRAVYTHADYLAVNISSPNTPGLRELQGGRYVEELCRELMREGRNLSRRHDVPRRPILVKIAPDLSRHELDEVLAAVMDVGVDGIIATNTTLRRPGIRHPLRAEPGGLSGDPLRRRSTLLISYIHGATRGLIPIVGAGGVRTADDAREKLDAGASLLQIYTGMVYEGPRIAGHILRGVVR